MKYLFLEVKNRGQKQRYEIRHLVKKELRFKEEMSSEEVSLSLLLSNRQLLTPSETPATRDSIFVCLLMDVDSTL